MTERLLALWLTLWQRTTAALTGWVAGSRGWLGD